MCELLNQLVKYDPKVLDKHPKLKEYLHRFEVRSEIYGRHIIFAMHGFDWSKLCLCICTHNRPIKFRCDDISKRKLNHHPFSGLYLLYFLEFATIEGLHGVE